MVESVIIFITIFLLSLINLVSQETFYFYGLSAYTL